MVNEQTASLRNWTSNIQQFLLRPSSAAFCNRCYYIMCISIYHFKKTCILSTREELWQQPPCSSLRFSKVPGGNKGCITATRCRAEWCSADVQEKYKGAEEGSAIRLPQCICCSSHLTNRQQRRSGLDWQHKFSILCQDSPGHDLKIVLRDHFSQCYPSQRQI